jgi:hypothetical protein
MNDFTEMFGDATENVTSVQNNAISSTFGSINNAVNAITAPFNNLSKGITDTLAGLNPNLILMGVAGIAVLYFMKK